MCRMRSRLTVSGSHVDNTKVSPAIGRGKQRPYKLAQIVFNYTRFNRCTTLRVLLSVLLALGAFINPSVAAAKPVTQVPFTYVIDYRTGQLGNAEFMSTMREAPPTLFHTGFGPTLFASSWGAGGHAEEEALQLQSPDELRTRMAKIKQFTDELHDAGVKLVIPYLCNQSLFGDDKLRTGLWAFYDRWDEYAEFGIGAKPSADPIEWLQREASGFPHYNYPRHLIHSEKRPYYRYAPCPNNAHWRQFCAASVKAMARGGYDGVFVDNNILHCYGSWCQAGFKKYLARKYSPRELEERFGDADVNELSLSTAGDIILWARSYPSFVEFLENKFQEEERQSAFWTTDTLSERDIDAAGGGFLIGQAEEFIRTRVLGGRELHNFEQLRNANPALQDPHSRLLWAETKRFWGDSIGNMLTMLEEAGQEINPGFFTLPNWGSMMRVRGAAGRAEDAHDMRRWLPSGSIQMYEEDTTPGTVAPGVTFDYVLQYKFALATGVRAAVLPYTLSSADIFDLAHAEGSASGGGVYIQPGFPYPEVRRKYRAFFENHPELFSGYKSCAEVAVAYWFDQLHLNNVNHFRMVDKIARYLKEQQIPFDFLTEYDWNLESVSEYKVLILPELLYVSDRELETVLEYVKRGGHVVSVGGTGAFDDLAITRPREKNLLAALDQAQRYIEKRLGSGSLLIAGDVGDILPADTFSLEQAFQICRDGELQRAFEEERGPQYAVVAKLDKLIGVDRLWDGGKLGGFIRESLGYNASIADPESALGMRFETFIKEEGQACRIVLHAVNYNIPLAAQDEPLAVKPVTRVKVRLMLPAGLRVQQVTMYDPDEPGPKELNFKQAGRRLELEIPSVRIHKLIDIAASRRGQSSS